MTGQEEKPDRARRRPDGWLVAVIGLAVAVRVVLALAPQTGGNRLRMPDSMSYHYAARSLLERGELWFGEVQRAKREPGYPFFMAACYAPFYAVSEPPQPIESATRPSAAGHREAGPGDAYAWPPPPAVRLVQALVGALLCLPVYALSCRLGGRRAGRAAAVLAALHPSLVGVSALVLTETLYTTLLWTALWVTTGRGWRWRGALGAGLAWAALGAVRSEALVLFAAVAVIALLVSWKRVSGTFSAKRAADGRPGRREKRSLTLCSRLAAGLVGLAVVTGLWAWRNARVVGHPVVTTLNVGETLYDGLWAGADGSSDKRFMADLIATDHWQSLDEVGRDRWLRRTALAYAQSHPGRMLGLAWRKVARTWRPVPSARTIGRAAGLVVGGAFVVVVLAGLVGCVRHRRRWRDWVVWLVPAVVMTAAHLVIVGSMRYRIPVMPFFIVMGGASLVRSRRIPDD